MQRDMETESRGSSMILGKAWAGLLAGVALLILSPKLSPGNQSGGRGSPVAALLFCVGNLRVGSHCSGSEALRFGRLLEWPKGFSGHRVPGCTPRALAL